MKGYPVDCGYMGYMPTCGCYCLFSDEGDYKEAYNDVIFSE